MAKSNVFVQANDYEQVEGAISIRSFRIDRVMFAELVDASNGTVLGSGQAVRNPQDADDETLAFAIAIERAAFDFYRKNRKVRTKLQHAHC